MKNLRVQIEAQLNSLLAEVPARQRPLLFIGLFFSVLILVWLLLWAPLASTRSTLRREIGVKEQELAWMRTASESVRQYTTGAGQGAPPLTIIDASARQFGLGQAIQRIEPGGQREVRVWMENAVFDDLLRWLGRLKQEHGIDVAEIVVEQGRAGSALVNARLTLERGE